MWAQQRRVQEQTQQYYNQAGPPPHAGYHGDPGHQVVAQQYPKNEHDAQFSKQQNRYEYSEERQESAEPPPLPPESDEPAPPGLMPEEPLPSTDNMETVAMEADAPEAAATIVSDKPYKQEFSQKPGFTVSNFDTVHSAIPNHPNYHPSPPPLADMETFDHNHGYDVPPPAPQTFSGPQQFDYGHQSTSVDYNHQRQGPVVFDYSRQYDGGYHQLPYEGEGYYPVLPSQEHTPSAEVAIGHGPIDFSTLSGKF